MRVHNFFPLYKGTFCVGAQNCVRGTQFFPLILREHSVWGYTVFPLNIKGTFCVGVHSFFP